MPTQPQTWQVLQAVQTLIQNEVLVSSASPFSTFSSTANPSNPGNASDATRYGTNPNGTITNAIFIGVPKDFSNMYPKQCHIVPASAENVARHNFGAGVWDYMDILIRLIFSRKQDWYQAQQDIIAARDALWPVLTKHTELPNAPGVAASIPQPVAGARSFMPGIEIGVEWDDWTVQWRLKQVWSVSGAGFVS